MSKTGSVIASIIGLALAIVSCALFPQTVTTDTNTASASLLSLIPGMIAAVIAALIVRGRGGGHRYLRLAIPLLSAIAFAALSSALSSRIIRMRIDPRNVADHGASVDSSFAIALVIGVIAYLAAATIYGFVGTAQGVRIGARIGLLLLLLAAVFPFADIVGMIGLLIVSVARRPAVPLVVAPTESSQTE